MHCLDVRDFFFSRSSLCPLAPCSPAQRLWHTMQWHLIQFDPDLRGLFVIHNFEQTNVTHSKWFALYLTFPISRRSTFLLKGIDLAARTQPRPVNRVLALTLTINSHWRRLLRVAAADAGHATARLAGLGTEVVNGCSLCVAIRGNRI
jgi:hypothetical protein